MVTKPLNRYVRLDKYRDWLVFFRLIHTGDKSTGFKCFYKRNILLLSNGGKSDNNLCVSDDLFWCHIAKIENGNEKNKPVYFRLV